MKHTLPYFLLIFVVACSTSKPTEPVSNVFCDSARAMDSTRLATTYNNICSRLDNTRSKLHLEYSSASSAGKKKILDKARTLLLTTLTDSIFPCWYGTGWDFNGTTTCPRTGKIACGYFVTTVLSQAGFNMDRIYYAQQASSVMINTLCTGNIKTITNHQLDKVIAYVKEKEDGIFMLGLDNHTGFLVKKGDEISFIDSDYENGMGVRSEKAADSNILHWNGYFLIGDLSHSDGTIIKWLKGDSIR